MADEPNKVTAVHGDIGECPLCGAKGHFDLLDTKEVNFKDSIWLNKHTGGWECYYCWLK